MDYTLAVYKSPLFESITYDLAINQLIKLGYPEEISKLKYDPSFPIRGLFVDTLLGNFLEVDSFRFIYQAVHGKKSLTSSQRREAYPSSQVPPEDIGTRYFMMNTLFNLVDACLFSDLVEFYENLDGADEGFSEMSGFTFTNLFSDIRKAVDTVHHNGELKDKTIEMVEQLVDRTPKLSILLDRLSKSGKKTFLLTNSGYSYTERLMSYLLNGFSEEKPNWKDYFDYIIVAAKKPSFFSSGTALREVNLETGTLSVKNITKFEKGKVYNGGSMSVFSRLSGSVGQDVLYVGDHIFSDVIVSKKQHRWRNLLVIRELADEVDIQKSERYAELLKHLHNLNFVFRETYRNLDSTATELTDISPLRKHMKKTVKELSKCYNGTFGSLFRSGSKNSFFAMQVMRYADMYTADYSSLLNYPLFYYFSAPPSPLPHETLDTEVSFLQ